MTFTTSRFRLHRGSCEMLGREAGNGAPVAISAASYSGHLRRGEVDCAEPAANPRVPLSMSQIRSPQGSCARNDLSQLERSGALKGVAPNTT